MKNSVYSFNQMCKYYCDMMWFVFYPINKKDVGYKIIDYIAIVRDIMYVY